jgi:hypothetical protein
VSKGVSVDDSEVQGNLAGLRRLQLRPALERACDVIEAKSVPMSPILTGNLASSFVREIRDGEAEFGFSAPYAAEVHEMPEDRRGARTREAPGNEYGQAGPRWLLRAIIGMTADGLLVQEIGQALEQSLREELR